MIPSDYVVYKDLVSTSLKAILTKTMPSPITDGLQASVQRQLLWWSNFDCREGYEKCKAPDHARQQHPVA